MPAIRTEHAHTHGCLRICPVFLFKNRLLVAMGVVTCAETMNTSIEKLCDFAQKRHSRIIGNIKDLAAGAVLLSAVFAALAGGVVLLRPAFWAVWEEILMQPKKLAVFILSLAASMALVFAVPLKRE